MLGAVATGSFDTIEQKVAWILNTYPDTRDSDVTLQLRYWETFVEDYDPATFEPNDLYRLPRLTSLCYVLSTFQHDIRAEKGTLSVIRRPALGETCTP